MKPSHNMGGMNIALHRSLFLLLFHVFICGGLRYYCR